MSVGTCRTGQARVHVDHGLGDRVHRVRRVEAAQHDTVRRRPQQAADDPARFLRDDEGRLEAVEPGVGTESPDQPQRQVVLGLVGREE